MKERYLLASDYDRTLAHNGEVSERVVRAIEQFRAKGNVFGVVTGRDYIFSYNIFSKNGKFPFDVLVMATGAMACNSKGEILFSSDAENITLPSGKKLCEALVMRILELTSTPCGISLQTSRLDFHPELPFGGEISGRVYSPYSAAGEISLFVHANARCETPEDAERVSKILSSEFGEWINPVQNTTAIDMPPVNISKRVGVFKIAEHYGIGYDNTFVAGDANNDVEMLKSFHSFAMKAGVPAAIAAAECAANDIAEVIENIIK